MRAIINLFNGSVSLVDYFINPNVIANINASGSYQVSPVILQPLLDGAITNPPTIVNCPNMWYLMLNSKNSANMSVDPTEQTTFGSTVGFNYLGLNNSVLASTGNARYQNFNLNMLTDIEGDLFGNSLSLGLNTVGTQTYYILIILPEAQFNPLMSIVNSNTITIYSTLNTLFYINISANSSSQFAPNASGLVATSASKTSTTSNTVNNTNSVSIAPVYNISKLILSVSNTRLF